MVGRSLQLTDAVGLIGHSGDDAPLVRGPWKRFARLKHGSLEETHNSFDADN